MQVFSMSRSPVFLLKPVVFFRQSKLALAC
jgi:hypothetical protein